MLEIGDIFQVWESLADMARDIDMPYATVAKWAQRSRIPPESWQLVIEAAGRRGTKLTAAKMLRLNKPRASAQAEVRAS